MSEIVREVRRDVTEYYSKIFEDFGMSPTMIKVYMSLFFSGKPMGLQEIAEDTGYSVSTVCQAAELLDRYVDVRKFRKPGSKKVYYECTHDIKKAMRKKFGGMRDMINGLVKVLKESETKLNDSKDPEAEHILKDITQLRKDYDKVDKLFEILITMRIIGEHDEAQE